MTRKIRKYRSGPSKKLGKWSNIGQRLGVNHRRQGSHAKIGKMWIWPKDFMIPKKGENQRIWCSSFSARIRSTCSWQYVRTKNSKMNHEPIILVENPEKKNGVESWKIEGFIINNWDLTIKQKANYKPNIMPEIVGLRKNPWMDSFTI